MKNISKSFFLFVAVFLNLSVYGQTFRNIFSKQVSATLSTNEEEEIRKQIRADVNFLSSFQLEGRRAGEPGGMKTALYLSNRLNQMGVESINMQSDFEIYAGGRYGGRTRMIINQAFVRIPEEATTLSFPENLQFSDHFIKNHKEPLTPWVIPLFDQSSEDKRSNTEINNRIQDLVSQALVNDANALFIYDQYDEVKAYNELPQYLEVTIPIVFIGYTAYNKHLKNQQHLASISFHLEWVHDKKRTENVYGYINHNADKTILISASYDSKGFYYDSSLPYGNNKMIYYGADKNASGVAATLAIVQALMLKKELPSDYNYIIAFYSAAQNGHQGIQHFLKEMPDSLKRQLYFALHFDHVGRYQSNIGLYINGLAPEHIGNVLSHQSTSKLILNIGGPPLPYSDATIYEQFNLPALSIHTGIQEDHDKVSDHASKVNISSVFNVSKAFYQLLNARHFPELFPLSLSTPQKNRMVKKVPVKWEEWGIVFDSSYEGLGKQVKSISENGMANKVGLTSGDIIFNINQTPVVDESAIISALENLHYGTLVKIKIKRGVSVMDLESKL